MCRLPDFCCFVVLYSSLTIAFNLVPGCWVTIYETNTTTAGRIGRSVTWYLNSSPDSPMALLQTILLLANHSSSRLKASICFSAVPACICVCGSKPAVLFWWLCLSYPVGLGTLACELWFLEGIFLGLEQQAITSSTPTGTHPFSMWL